MVSLRRVPLALSVSIAVVDLAGVRILRGVPTGWQLLLLCNGRTRALLLDGRRPQRRHRKWPQRSRRAQSESETRADYKAHGVGALEDACPGRPAQDSLASDNHA